MKMRTWFPLLGLAVLLAAGCVVHGRAEVRTAPPPTVVVTEPTPPPPTIVVGEPTPPPPIIVVREPTPPPPTVVQPPPPTVVHPPPPTVVGPPPPTVVGPPPPTVVHPPPPTVVQPPPPTVVQPPPPTVVQPPPPTVVQPPPPVGPPPPTVVLDRAGDTGSERAPSVSSPNPICSSEGVTEGCPQGTICARHGQLPLACRRICEEQNVCGAEEQCLGAARINRRVCVPR